MKTTLPAEREYGPEMAALSPRRRAFVDAMFIASNATEAARLAGFVDGPGVAVTAHRILRDEKVRSALYAEAKRRLRVEGLPKAVAAVLEISADRTHKHRLAASVAIMNRAGLHEVTEHREKVEVEMTVSEKFAELLRLGAKPEEVLMNLPADEREAVLAILPPHERAALEHTRTGIQNATEA